MVYKRSLWKEQDAFNEIKTAVTSTPCLALIDFAKEHNELFLYTDISKIGLSSTLMVRNVDGHRPVIFHC